MWHGSSLPNGNGEKSTDLGWVNGVNLVGKRGKSRIIWSVGLIKWPDGGTCFWNAKGRRGKREGWGELGISRKNNGTEHPRHPGKCWNYPLGKSPVVFYRSKSVCLTQADLPQWAVSPGEVGMKGIPVEVWESLKIKEYIRVHSGNQYGVPLCDSPGISVWEPERRGAVRCLPRSLLLTTRPFPFYREAPRNEGRYL